MGSDTWAFKMKGGWWFESNSEEARPRAERTEEEETTRGAVGNAPSSGETVASP